MSMLSMLCTLKHLCSSLTLPPLRIQRLNRSGRGLCLWMKNISWRNMPRTDFYFIGTLCQRTTLKMFAYLWLFLFLKQQAWATDDVAQIYDKCITELEQHLHAIPPTLAMNPQAQALRSLLEVVVLSRNSRDAIAALGLLQKVCFKLCL